MFTTEIDVVWKSDAMERVGRLTNKGVRLKLNIWRR